MAAKTISLLAAPMRVLLFHGYMLRGTGSNIYNANLARGPGPARP